MSWIDNINKKLEEQRAAYRESIESGEAFKKRQAYASKQRDNKERKDQFAKIKTSEHQSFAAKNAGNKNLETGHWDNIKHLGTEVAHSTIKCPHCNFEGDLVNIKRHHFDNCQQKYELVKCIFDELNDNFTKSELINSIIKNGFKPTFSQALLRNINYIELIHRGTKGSTKDINIYKKKQI